ncbi:MAG: hypothetical protein IJZ60_08120 [Bacteroides sp.]|nr:hypothetical protein [Bacteroides sp.]
MKKFLILAFAGFTAYNVYQANATKQMVALMNIQQVEALASGEGGGKVCKWSQQTCSNGNVREVCLDDGNGSVCECGSVTRPC